MQLGQNHLCYPAFLNLWADRFSLPEGPVGDSTLITRHDLLSAATIATRRYRLMVARLLHPRYPGLTLPRACLEHFTFATPQLLPLDARQKSQIYRRNFFHPYYPARARS